MTAFEAERQAEASRQITQMIEGTVADILDLDVEHYLTYYKTGPELIFVQDGEITRSWEAFADLKRGVWAAIGEVEDFSYEMDVQVLAPTAGAVTMAFEIKATTPEGDPFKGAGTFSGVCSKEEGGWKIVNAVEWFQPS